ncbi:hypothetical protein STAFG_8899 [Streptomyces afghaniensis 772]|uniref:Uncharacterized protein n=1 Tax=Streptomyces afghaniensis 772 TaxID=1283301 RepID=S4N923_9ACTN|nr:hypothetical protein STAFG_8899 [Streptomyces afghaniensis 772]
MCLLTVPWRSTAVRPARPGSRPPLPRTVRPTTDNAPEQRRAPRRPHASTSQDAQSTLARSLSAEIAFILWRGVSFMRAERMGGAKSYARGPGRPRGGTGLRTVP